MNWASARGRTTAPADVTPVATGPVLVMACPPGPGADEGGSGTGLRGARLRDDMRGDRAQDCLRPTPSQAVEGLSRGVGPGSWLLLDGADGRAVSVGGSRPSVPRDRDEAAKSQPGLCPSRAASRVTAASMRPRWVKACGKLPICSPVRAISSEYRPTWLP